MKKNVKSLVEEHRYKSYMSSEAFLKLLKEGSLINKFLYAFINTPVYDSKEPSKIYEKPYEKYMAFLISKKTGSKLSGKSEEYQLNKKIEEYGKKFPELLSAFMKYTPLYRVFFDGAIYHRGEDLFVDSTWEKNSNISLSITTHIVHKGKLYALKNPKKYKLIQKFGDALSIGFAQNPEQYYQELKKDYRDMLCWEMKKK